MYLGNLCRRTKRQPTVVRLRRSSFNFSVTRDKNEGYGTTRRKRISTKVLSLNEDPDLTLLDNLDWIISFPVRSLFHWVLDDMPASDNNDAQMNSYQGIETSHAVERASSGSNGEFGNELQGHNSLNESRIQSGLVPQFVSCSLPSRSGSSGKPTLTYPQLIECCLKEKGALTVNEIYQWISNHYPFYENSDDGWKNAVRHNLSMQSQFRKGEKVRGKSHIWYLDYNYRKGSKRQCLRTSYPTFEEEAEQFYPSNCNIKPEGYKLEGSHLMPNACLTHDERLEDSGSRTLSEVTESFATGSGIGNPGEMPFRTNADQEQNWQYLGDVMSGAAPHSQDWISQSGFPMESEFNEYSGTPSAGNYFHPVMPKLECHDLIHELDVKYDVTADDLLQALDAMVEEDCPLS